MSKTALVTTTIHIPRNIEGYLANFTAHGHTDVEVIVIGDLKSPSGTVGYLADLEDKTGYRISYWDVQRQRRWLNDLPELDKLLPYNSIQRRNLAYLQAVIAGAECIISIDDDNYVTDVDYLGGHLIVGQRVSLASVWSSSGWFNTCSLLETIPEKPLYHRGFPVKKRGAAPQLRYSLLESRVVVNVGLWSGVPDADAMSHLDCPTDVTGLRKGFDGRVLVAPGTNLAFNSQNTAFHRDLLPCMFLIPMGDRVGDLKIGRYDDIWMSFFAKIVIDRMADSICVGIPLTRQERNEHDLFADLLAEVPGMQITNYLIEALERVRLSKGDYCSCYVELIEQVRRLIKDFGEEDHRYLETVLSRMEVWAEVSRQTLRTVA